MDPLETAERRSRMSPVKTTEMMDQVRVSGFTRMLTGRCTLAFMLRVLLAVTPETNPRMALERQKPSLAVTQPIKLAAGR